MGWRVRALHRVLHPMRTLKMCVMLLASMSLSGTFFWVTTTTQSLPRTPMLVMPAAFTALKAYSVSLQYV